MRKMQIILVIVAVLVLAIGGIGWLACGGWKQVGTHYDDDYASADSISEIRVTGTVAVTVKPGASAGIEIHRTARYLNAFHSHPERTHRVDGTVLTLGGDDSSMFSVMEYVVTVPAGVRVTGQTDNGSLDLTGVSTVDVSTSRGSVTVVDATGDVTVRASMGSITGRGLHSGSVVVSSTMGAISLELVQPGNVEARTSMGALSVTVPRGSYRVDAQTGGGASQIGIANDPNAPYRLVLHTDLGKLELAAA